MSLTSGSTLGAYQLIELLGAGGMGEVWRALDPGLRRHVAIKILPAQYSRDPDRLRRFEQEAHAAGRLNHPNVLSVYAIGEQDGFPYLVTELLEGKTLRQTLVGGAVPEAKALAYADQLVQGLAAAHDRGIVHRDLKPDNVFVTTDERIKILDFGLAKLVSSDPSIDAATQTGTGVALGTPAYMSPEQIRGHAVDHRTDVFAVGVVLYEMLAGRRPFVGETSAETMTSILREEPRPLTGVSPQLEQIVRHCLEKDVAARYQSARDLAFQLRLVQQPSVALPLSPRRNRAVMLPLVAAVVLATTIGVTWWLTRPEREGAAATFRRLTSDSGLTSDPALSPDGRLVAYASDRAGQGLDIWLQQLATGEAVRLTSDAADESEPTFSPDGTRVAFRSERDGGGIWSVSALGGEPRLIVPRGRRPRFSPDGSQIAFWVSTLWYVGHVFTVPSGGGTPTAVQPTFWSALYPIWSADGTKLLFLGVPAAKEAPSGANFDWWIAPLGDGAPQKTGAVAILREQGIVAGRGGQWLIGAEEWIGNDVYFAGGSDETMNLWRLAVSPQTAQVEGALQKLTSGTAIETKPSIIAGGRRAAFATVSNAINIWRLDLDANSGTVTGSTQQVTNSAFDARTSVSADGKKLVFISSRLGNPDVWLKDLETGKEIALTATPIREEEPEISPDGSRVLYVVWDGTQGSVHQQPTGGGAAERICDDCGRPWDWSPDGSKFLYLIVEGLRTPNTALGVFDIATRQKTDYIVSTRANVARARFSPDGRWVSFTALNSGGTRLVVAPFRPGALARDDEWIFITEQQPFTQDKTRWSPDGTLLYYLSDSDGFRCIWAQRLDAVSKQPVGAPLAIHHSHSARRSLANVRVPLFFELSLTADKLFFNLGETTGNIWMAEWPQ